MFRFRVYGLLAVLPTATYIFSTVANGFGLRRAT